MKNKFVRFFEVSYLQMLLSILLMIIATVGVLLFWNATKNAEQVLLEKTKLRQSILANAGSQEIENFFDARKVKLHYLANLEEIKTENEVKGRKALKDFIDQVKDKPLTSLVRIDKNGKVLWSENKMHQKVEEGIDASDRSYFQWAKKQTEEGSVILSEPVVARTGLAKGSLVIVMATPVFYKGQFNGVLTMVISTNELTEKFIGPLTVSPDSQQFILEKNGHVIASHTYPYASEEISTEPFENQNRSLVMDLTVNGQKQKRIVGYAPIEIDQNYWYLLVTVPYKEVFDQLNPFSQIQNQGLVLLAIAIIVIILFDVLIMRIAERQGYRNGYSACLSEDCKTKNKKE